MQLLKLAARTVLGDRLDDGRLRHLEAECGRRQPRGLELAAHQLAHAAGRELPAGYVDPGHEGIRKQALGPPARGLGACLTEHELAQGKDQPGRLRHRYEPARGHRAERRRVPAQQRFDADDSRAVEGHLGLVVDAQLPALQAQPQLVLQPQHLAQLTRHVVVVDLEAAATGLLRRVHRDVGVPQQLLAVALPAGMHGDPDARPDRQLMAGDHHRLR